MKQERVIQGRLITPEDVELIRGLIEENPSWHRTRLSQELCRRWNGYNGKGQMKDMASRTLLLKLERMGYLTLPPVAPQGSANPNRNRNQTIPLVLHDTSPLHGTLDDVRPVRVSPVENPWHKDLFACLIHEYHYLSYRGIVGENLKYVVWDVRERPLGCLLFGSAAWKTKPRDEFIGWDRSTRERNLSLITNNMRFLILPWVRIPHLASHVLGQVGRRIRTDWEQKYGHPVYLLETFVERDRFEGTCYRAANWICVGDTTGRTRNDRKNPILQVPRKAVYLYPLVKGVCRRLQESGGERDEHAEPSHK